MTPIISALRSRNSISSFTTKAACAIIAGALFVPLYVQADVVVLKDSVNGHVNIRSAPEGDAEILGSLGRGEMLPHVEASGHRWRELRLPDGRTGFISQTWTDVIPDPVASADESAEQELVGEATSYALSEANEVPDIPKTYDVPAIAESSVEAPEPEHAENATEAPAPLEIVEESVAKEAGDANADSEDQVIVDEQAAELSIAEQVEEVIEPEQATVAVIPEAVEEAVDPEPSDEPLVAEDSADAVEPAVEREPIEHRPVVAPRSDNLVGTPNYVVKFTESTIGGNSNIFDNGINVGIGNANPQEALDVNGNIQLHNRNSNIAVLTLTQAAGDTGYIMHNLSGTMTIGAGSEDRITIDRNGNVGIGTNRPKFPLEMASGAGVTAGGVLTNASSAEYKENVVDLGIDEALEALAELRPVRFSYKLDDGDEYVGFIAEDVPDLVASEDRRSLSPMDIVAVLTRALQAQQQQIEELERRLDER